MARQKWDRDKVVKRIQERASEGLALNSDAIVHEEESLMGAARRYFGSWKNALLESGFDPNEHQKPRVPTRSWDKATIVVEIKKLASEGVDLNAHAVKRINSKLVSAGTAHFGSWGDAIEAAGIDYEIIRKTAKWTKDDVIAIIQEAHKVNADLSDNTVRALNEPLYGAAYYYFGSWDKAIEAAGVDYDQVRRTTAWSKEKLLDALVRGQATSAVKKEIIDVFGSMEDARKIAGLIDETNLGTTNRMRERRIELGLSQEEVAERVECSHAWIRHLERQNLRDFKLSWALKIAEALETTVDDLFKLDKDQSN